MSKVKKILKHWESKPKLVEKEEVISILKRFGFNLDFKRGSHIIVSHSRLINRSGFGQDGEFTLPIKGGKKVKGYYLKNILEAISILEEGKNNE